MSINPKAQYGALKPSLSAVPTEVLWELGAAMREGANKYGRHNYVATEIDVSTYFDAAQRHLCAFWLGEDIDQDSGISHVTKAIACLAVLRVSMIHGSIVDDRPPMAPEGFWDELRETVAAIDRRTPPTAAAFTQSEAMECGNRFHSTQRGLADAEALANDNANFLLAQEAAGAEATRNRIQSQCARKAEEALGAKLNEVA